MRSRIYQLLRSPIFISSFIIFLSSGITLLSPVQIDTHIHDHFVFWDGAYNIKNGYIPHIDFSTPLGGTLFWLTYLSYAISGSWALSIPLAVTLSSICITFASYALLKKSMSKFYLSVYLCFITLICFSPYVDSTPLVDTSYAMWYNRLGLVCFSSICLYVLYFRSSYTFKYYQSLGLCFLILFLLYTKITYFLVSVSVISTIGGFNLYKKKMFYVSLAYVLLSALIIEGIFNGYVYGYVRDLITAYRSSSVGVARGGVGGMVVYVASNSVLIVSFLFSVLAYWYWRRRSWIKIAQMALIFVGSWWLANRATASVPLSLATVPLWIADVSAPEEMAPLHSLDLFGRDISLVRAITFCLTVFAILPVAGKRLATLTAYAAGADGGNVTRVSRTLDGFERLSVSRGKLGDGLTEIGDSGISLPFYFNKAGALKDKKQTTRVKVRGTDYIKCLVSAKNLLKSKVSDDQGVFVFDFVNAVNLVSNRKPLGGGMLWYHYQMTFSVGTLKSDKEWLGGVKYVMIPKVPLMYESRNNMIKAAKSELLKRYNLSAENNIWLLLKKES